MMWRIAAFARRLDPRLKLGTALLLGPCMWLLPPLSVLGCTLLFLLLVSALAASQPLGSKMVRSLITFVLFWVVIKSVLEAVSGMPAMQILMDSGVLALRLSGLLLLGLSLALSTSARALGLAVSWLISPLVGRERAWRVALSLALMVHFLPLCLSTMNQVRETLSRRWPHCGFRQRMVLIPQAVLRNLGQRTWSQTLAVAGRGLESADAWKPDFSWSLSDSVCAVVLAGSAASLYFF